MLLSCHNLLDVGYVLVEHYAAKLESSEELRRSVNVMGGIILLVASRCAGSL